jgi:hypothetical protein
MSRGQYSGDLARPPAKLADVMREKIEATFDDRALLRNKNIARRSWTL